MNVQDVWILYRRELKAALRERNIVLNSLLLPVLLYPVVLWLTFSAVTFLQGQEERFVSRLAWTGLPDEHRELEEKLSQTKKITWIDVPPMSAARQLIASGELDAFAEIRPAEGVASELVGNFELQLLYDGAKDRSSKARQRVREALDVYRHQWLERHATELGISDEDWRLFSLDHQNVASGSDVGAFILGLMVPLLMIIMIAVGCFYPAVDATAGERERSTWETLMTVGASRASIVIAKYLYVATLGTVAGLLNLVAMVVSMRGILEPLLSGADRKLDFSMPWAALPVLALAALFLALFIAAGMMIFASFARTFKEGQSMIGPFYLLCLLPPLLVQAPDLELTPKLALIPIVNITLLCRAVIGGTFDLPLIALTFIVELATVALCLEVARRLLRFEDVLLGSYSGSFLKFLRQRWLGDKERPGRSRHA